MSGHRRNSRMNEFTMNDAARGDDRSDESCIEPGDAVKMLTSSCTAEQTESVLALVRPADRRRLIRQADTRRDGLQRAKARAEWVDRPLPFGEAS